MRGLGSGWGQGMARAGSIFGFFLFPMIVSSAGMGPTLLLIAAVPIVGLAFCLAIKWDPKNVDAVPRLDVAPATQRMVPDQGAADHG
jgi:hypothetical protein